jgi:hypothetical protein
MNIEKEMLEAIRDTQTNKDNPTLAKSCAAIAQGVAKGFDIWKTKNGWTQNSTSWEYFNKYDIEKGFKTFSELFQIFLNEKK